MDAGQCETRSRRDRQPASRGECRQGRPGWTLVELVVVVTVLCVLLSMSAPLFHRAVEQSRADVAAANLRSVWAAQQLYWLDNHTYTGNFSDLSALIDPSIPTGTPFYSYAITQAGGSSFTVTATRVGSTQWAGTLSMDQTGTLTGSIQAAGQSAIVPGYQ